MLTREELGAWLRLVETPGIGAASARKLLATFGSAEQVLSAPEGARGKVVGATKAAALNRPSPGFAELLATTWHWLHSAIEPPARHILTLGDPHYPPALLHTADPPLLLYALGDTARLSARAIAMVGSRNATPQGLANARAFGQYLSERNITIVSGLALGIDGAAHAGGLCGPGSTVAFIGTGLDRVYPKFHAELARQIAQQGCIASEFALGTPPLAPNFPRRNRLIAGISQGTLVVEATLQSGSLITARLALEAGREVYAIPGSIHSPQSRGCHRLIQQGAKLVETGEDILSELPPAHPSLNTSLAKLAPTTEPLLSMAVPDRDEPPSTQNTLLAAVGYDPVSFDALAAQTGLASAVLAARLLELELSGKIHRLPGGLLQRGANA